MIALILTAIIVAGYAASLWWLLREERRTALWLLALLCCLALTLRLAYTTDFPAGLNEDESKILTCSMLALHGGQLFDEGCTGLPVLLSCLFQAQLVPLLGPNRWAIRSYSLVTSVLATAAAFAVGRSLRWRNASSLVVAGLVAVLPWSIFYGRISIGGELVFHQMLLLAALARLTTRQGGAVEVGIGAFAQGLLLYDYFCGRTFLPFSFVAAVLAPRRSRLACLMIPVLALLGWIPYLWSLPPYAYGLDSAMNPDFLAAPLQTAWERSASTLQSFALPAGLDGWLTVRAAAIHPPLVLMGAIVGLIAALRRPRLFFFLAAGFVLGIAPAVLTETPYPSAHRMLMAFPFVALAAGYAVEIISWARGRQIVALMFVALAAWQSTRLYFSQTFWWQGSRDHFDWETTGIVEMVPYPAPSRVVAARQIGNHMTARAFLEPKVEWLTLDNWMPKPGESTTYLFAAPSVELRPFYEALVGPARVLSSGRAFLVRLEERDWSWLGRHGWTYSAGCGDTVKQIHVPTLFQPSLSFTDFVCQGPTLHVWRGRWTGRAKDLRFFFEGEASVQTRAVLLRSDTKVLDFHVAPDEEIVVRLSQPPGSAFDARLLEITPAGERVPPWSDVVPQ